MKTVSFEKYDIRCGALGTCPKYHCYAPGDQSGEYVRAEVAQAKIEAIEKALETIEKWNRSKSNQADKREAISQIVEYAIVLANE